MGAGASTGDTNTKQEKSILRMFRYFCSGWPEGYETFDCSSGWAMGSEAVINTRVASEQVKEVGRLDCDTMGAPKCEIAHLGGDDEIKTSHEMVDKASSEKLIQEFPELSLDAVAVGLMSIGPSDKDAAEIMDILLKYGDFARFGQFMRDTFDLLRQVSVQVFHLAGSIIGANQRIVNCA